jgi:hypothetical protein
MSNPAYDAKFLARHCNLMRDTALERPMGQRDIMPQFADVRIGAGLPAPVRRLSGFA